MMEHNSSNNTQADVILKSVTVAFGEKTVLNAISHTFYAGSVTAVTGASGSGKTTLLRAVAGLCPYDGEIICPGVISFSYQTPRLLLWRNAIYNVALPLLSLMSRDEAFSAAGRALEALGLETCAELMPGELSGGMAARVSIARAVAYLDANVKINSSGASRAAALLLDEPTRELDAESRRNIIRLVTSRRGDNVAVITATHDEELIGACDAVLRL